MGSSGAHRDVPETEIAVVVFARALRAGGLTELAGRITNAAIRLLLLQ
jgi:hypothetical protein